MIIPKSTAQSNPPASANTIAVPRQTSFHVPSGSYPATIRSAKKRQRQSFDTSVPMVRLVFNVQVPGANVDYLAKLDLKEDLREGSDLWSIVYRLLGRKVLQECSEKEFSLDALQDVPCHVQIDHNHDNAEDYEFPLVVVSDVQSAGQKQGANV